MTIMSFDSEDDGCNYVNDAEHSKMDVLGSADTLQLLLAMQLYPLSFMCSLVEFRHCRRPFRKVFIRCLLSLWSAEPAGKWNKKTVCFSF